MAAVDYAAVWQRFVAAGRTAGFDRGVERSLASGCTAVFAYVIFLASHPEIVRRVRDLQERLRLPFARTVHEEALHVTVQGAGFLERLEPAEVEALAPAGHRVFGALEPFTLELSNANSFDSVAFLEVWDGGAIHAARARLRQALPWLAERGHDPYVRGGLSAGRDVPRRRASSEPPGACDALPGKVIDLFTPHVTLAHYTADAGNQRIVAAVEPFRTYDVGPVRVDSVELVKVMLAGWKDRRVTPDTVQRLAAFRLGSSGAASS